MTLKTVMLLVLFVILTWGGSAGIAYGVVELTGGGSQGEQGEQGERGERGPQGTRGLAGAGTGLDSSGLRTLATFWAAAQVGENTSHPATVACVEFILSRVGSSADCKFFPADANLMETSWRCSASRRFINDCQVRT